MCVWSPANIFITKFEVKDGLPVDTRISTVHQWVFQSISSFLKKNKVLVKFKIWFKMMIPPASDRWELTSPVWNLKFVKKAACFDKEENTKGNKCIGNLLF